MIHRREAEGALVLPHRCQYHLSVVLEVFRCVLESEPVLADCRQDDGAWRVLEERRKKGGGERGEGEGRVGRG